MDCYNKVLTGKKKEPLEGEKSLAEAKSVLSRVSAWDPTFASAEVSLLFVYPSEKRWTSHNESKA